MLRLLCVFILTLTACHRPASRGIDSTTEGLADALALRPGQVGADIGSSDVIKHALVMARRIAPSGRLYVEDVDANILNRHRDLLSKELASEPKIFERVTYVNGSPTDPQLPESVDAVLIADAFHDFDRPVEMLRRIRRYMKPGARLVITERISISGRTLPRSEQVQIHQLDPVLVVDDVEAAGFARLTLKPEFQQMKDEGLTRWLLVAVN